MLTNRKRILLLFILFSLITNLKGEELKYLPHLSRILKGSEWWKSESKADSVRKAYLEEWDSFITQPQIKSLKWDFNYGLDHGFEWTMPAIDWHEASGALKLINDEDKRGGSRGRYGTTTYSAMLRTHFSEKQIKQFLIRSDGYAAWNCVAELYYWKKRRKPDEGWRGVWAGYNSGYKGGEEYSAIIAARVWVLKHRLFK